MSKKAYIGIFAIVLSQAVYTTYLVRENVQHEKQMREQRIALFEQLFQLSKEKSETTIPRPSVQSVQPIKQIEPCLIDSFDKQGNEMGGRSSTYVKEPSGVFAGKDGNIKHGESGKSLKIRYKKANQGGPFGKGGWCGYYSVIKSGPRKYFDASRYNYLTFWVKGSEGGENFQVGIADEEQEQHEDFVKTEEIAVYLPDGKITTEWQQARIPFDEIFVDLSKLASIEICFESDCFPDGGGKGTVYIDDMYFE